MSAAFSHTVERFGLVFSPALEKPMPRGMTFHMPQTPFYDHYSVPPEIPAGQRNTPPFEPQLPKGKDGRKQIFPLPV
jgi:hypothetical protein